MRMGVDVTVELVHMRLAQQIRIVSRIRLRPELED